MTKTGCNWLGLRWWKIWLLVDLESHYMFTAIHQLHDITTGAMAILRPTMKGQKMCRGPIHGNLCPFSKIAGIILPLISLWNDQIHKKYPIHILTPLIFSLSVDCVSSRAALAFWHRSHSVYEMCMSLNKSTSFHFASSWMTSNAET